MQDSTKIKKIIKFGAIALGLAGFLIVVRIFFIFTNPISLQYGAREIDLPIENYRAIAAGGPSINFFGGIRELMGFGVYDGDGAVWEFSTEMYPKSMSWRGSHIDFDASDNSITFSQGAQETPFEYISVKTPDIMDLSHVIEFKGKSKKVSRSQNGRYEAVAMSDTDKMEWVIKDLNQSIIWQCKMINCSSVIDWQYGIIEWHDEGTVVFTYDPNGCSYIKFFSMRTKPLLAPYLFLKGL